MAYYGLIIGACSFFIIGLLHPVVVKAEYHVGKQIWPLFLACGLACLALSLLIPNGIGSALLAVFGFSLLWSIRELHEQEERVAKGWFPANEKKKLKSDAKEV